MRFNPIVHPRFLTSQLTYELGRNGVFPPTRLKTILQTCAVDKCPRCQLLMSLEEPDDNGYFCSECWELDEMHKRAKTHE